MAASTSFHNIPPPPVSGPIPGPQGPKGDKGDTGPMGPEGPRGSSIAQTAEYTATSGQTVFDFPSVVSSSFVTVFRNGLKLPASGFTRSSTAVTLTTGATLGDNVSIIGFDQAETWGEGPDDGIWLDGGTGLDDGIWLAGDEILDDGPWA